MKRHGHQFLLKSQSVLRKLHSNSKPYEYSRLNEKAMEIRLLTLLPGEFPCEVRVCLEKVPFTDKAIPRFEALSYAWGSQENPVNILIGASGSRTLTVTRNLAEALPYLRYKDLPRVLWIDAVCVNQQDLEERGRQVKRMADIYSKAARVVVWLGPESNDSSVALDCFELIASHVDVDWEGQQKLIQVSTEEHWADEHESLPFEENEWNAISNLLNRSWFERLWIWQEIKLASSDSMVLCGTRVLRWSYMRTAAYCIYVKTLQEQNHQDGHTSLVYNLCLETGRSGLHHLLQLTTHSKCSDPRDRIFALLSLLPDFEKDLAIEPDYIKSAYEIYQDTVLRWINYTGKLNILNSGETHEAVEGLPSWVPDWSVTSTTNELTGFNASGYSRAITNFHEDGILQGTGVSVGIIDKVIAFDLPQSASWEECSDELVRVVSSLGLGQLSKGDAKLRALCKALCLDIFAERFDPPMSSLIPSMKQSEDALYSLLYNQSHTMTETPLSSAEKKLLDCIRIRGLNRSLFSTKDGHIGLAPKPTKVGDIVTVFLGYYSCMILRPVKSSQFQFIGEAYCNGFMEGQALMGLFPDNFTIVTRYVSEQNWRYWSFHDNETGTYHPEHPGLGPLPAGWTRKSHPNEEFLTLFENMENGKVTEDDPRLEPEMLKEQGVELRVFDLV